MALRYITLLLALSTSTLGQRPFYAGIRPVEPPQLQVNTSTTSGDRLGDGFAVSTIVAAGDVSTTTQRLPIEALGDRDLVNRLRKLPVDNQPFWLINWQALEVNRRNPQIYEQRPSHFGQPFHPSPSLQPVNSANSPSTTINTASIGLNTANIGPITSNIRPDSANISPSSAIISPSSASTNFPNIHTNPNSPAGSGFTSRAVGTSNSSPGDINPALSLGNRKEGSGSLKPTKTYDFVNPANDFAGSGFTSPAIRTSNSAPGERKVNSNPVLPLGDIDFTKPATGFANPGYDFVRPAISISNSAPADRKANRYPVLPLKDRTESSVIGSSANGNGFKNSALDGNTNLNANSGFPFDNTNRDSEHIISTSSFANPTIGTSNIASSNTNNNRNPISPLGNKVPSTNFANKKGVNENNENRNSNSANRNNSAYPKFDLHSFSQPDINDSGPDFEYEADDFPFNSNEDQHFEP